MYTTQQVKDEYKDIYEVYETLSKTRCVNIFIPRKTALIVWYEYNVAINYLNTIADRVGHEPKPFTEHVIYSSKDIMVPLVEFSPTPSPIVVDSLIINQFRDIPLTFATEMEKSRHNSLWVKLYEHPTVIPELDEKILGYGVWELNLPITKEDCKTYHPTYCHSLRNPIPSPNWGNWGVV